MNGDDMLEFEEFYHEELVEEYRKTYGKEPDEESSEWSEFVLRAMSDHYASMADYHYDAEGDDAPKE